eukprot:9095969-Pyramimonas_sp.AAC.2
MGLLQGPDGHPGQPWGHPGAERLWAARWPCRIIFDLSLADLGLFGVFVGATLGRSGPSQGLAVAPLTCPGRFRGRFDPFGGSPDPGKVTTHRCQCFNPHAFLAQAVWTHAVIRPYLSFITRTAGDHLFEAQWESAMADE